MSKVRINIEFSVGYVVVVYAEFGKVFDDSLLLVLRLPRATTSVAASPDQFKNQSSGVPPGSFGVIQIRCGTFRTLGLNGRNIWMIVSCVHISKTDTPTPSALSIVQIPTSPFFARIGLDSRLLLSAPLFDAEQRQEASSSDSDKEQERPWIAKWTRLSTRDANPPTTIDAENAAPPGLTPEPQADASRFQEGPFSDEHAVPQDTAAEGAAGAAAGTTTAAAAATATEQKKVPFYKVPGWWKTRNALIVWAVLGALGIALLFIILFPVIKAIAQLVVNRSILNVDTAAISNPSNSTFNLTMQGIVSHAGIFSAKITFTRPINVTWLINDTEIALGTMSLQPIFAKHKRATIDQTTAFTIVDEAAFGTFTETMITQPNFTWRLHSTGLRVNALKFPVAKGINFDKKLTLNGINNFDGNVVLKQFQLPSDAERGGINFSATTELNNTSPFKVDLGTVVFDLTYNNTFLGSGTGLNSAIQPGPNDITLNGVLVKQNTSDALASLSSLFTAYLNGDSSPVIAIGRSAAQPDGTIISWLSDGIKALRLNVPFKNPDSNGPLGPIKSITIGDMALAFNQDTPWAPVANTETVSAFMQLPFGFGVSIGEIMNSFNISQNGSSIAGLSTPLGSSTSNIRVLNSTDTEGTINITIDNIALSVPDIQHTLFSQFNTDLTQLTRSAFQLVGQSRAIANLSLGQVTLDPIKFNVTSGLDGLRGLQGDTTITGVDVLGGTTDGITLAINVSIFNPSNLNLSTGDLRLQLFRDGGLLGTTLLPNLTLVMGNNSLVSTGIFEANNSPQGRQTLDDFVGGTDVNVQIGGYSGSTNISSLSQAFGSLSLGATLPGLKSQLLSSTSLEVLSTTGWVNNTAHVTVNLDNPFSAGLQITQITSSVSSHGVPLGTINQNVAFSANGKSTTTSPTIDLQMNLDPPAIFSLTRRLAVMAGLGTDQLDGIVALGGYNYITTTDEDSGTGSGSNSSATKRDTNIFTNFNLPDFVDTAFKQLRSTVQLTSAVTIGDYNTELDYNQTDVPVKTDESLNMLLPFLAQPIVQKIVDGSLLGISAVTITNPQQTSFGTKLNGNITNAGPFDAKISFGSGLTISWSGKPLGTLKMPDVNLAADEGAQLDLTADFTVADVDHLTDFTKVLVTEESFQWDISGENLTISALGIDVPGINLTTKSVSLLGMNGLKGGVKINSFDLPSNDPAGGIHLTLNTTVQNPAQVGIELSSIGFRNFFQSTFIGPAAAQSEFTLAPQSSTDLPLVGRLVPQNGSATGLSDVSTMFNRFIHGEDSTVTVVGDSAGPSDVTWLNEGIKSLQIETSLPNQGKLDIIKAVTINQMELLFSVNDAYDPPSSSNDTTAAFTLPFAFPVDIVAVEQNITTGFQGQSFAELIIPKGPSTTDVEQRIIHLTFSNIPFAVFGDKHDVFQQFLAATTTSATQTFSLGGIANTDAQTAVGLLSLTDIEFDVDTSIAGLQGLNTKPATVSNLDVNHGFPDFLLIKVSTQLFNPSNLTIGTGDVSFGLQFENEDIGSAIVSDMIIIPGSANYSTDVHYQPQGGAVAAGQQMLENFLQGIDSDTTIVGSTDTTPIDSLKLALSEIKLSPVVIPALHQNLITSASLTFPTDIVQTGIASTSFTLSNPFTASINILKVSAKASYQDIFLGSIDNTQLSLHADGHSNVTSQTLPFHFNMNPVDIIHLLELRSQQTGVDLGPLPDLFQIVLNNPNQKTDITTTVDTSGSNCTSGKQFDVNGAILKALSGMGITLSVDSSNKLDDFATDLSFNQSNVPAQIDNTVLFLIGDVAPLIVQALVDQASLTFSQANITNIANEGFDLGLKGSLTGTGPLDAEITFVEPVNVNWNGHDIATISLPPVCAAANDGVPDYETSGHLTITDQGAFTEFATFLLHNPSFTWTISTNKLRVTALGTIFDNVSLSKDVTLKAFNNLPGVTISNFKLPSDDPAGGIHIETDSNIPSPAQLGIDLGTVTFNSFFKNVLVGPLTGQNLVLPPEATVTEHLSGRIVPQSGSDLDTIGELFSNFLAGENQTLSVTGDSVQPSGSGEVTWLSTAFKTLTLSVILPGQKFDIIQSITLEDLEVEMISQDQAFAPLTSSKTTLATYKNPFGFSLQVIESGENITLKDSGGTGVAALNLPRAPANGGVSTGNVADLILSFSNQTLQSLNNGAFESFFAAVTDTSSVSFSLVGTANVIAKTSIGNVPIDGIPFDVTSNLKGIDSFGGTASLSNVSITGSGGNGGNQFIVSPLTTTLDNPSNISLSTNDIALPVIFKGVKIGRAAINPFNLVPGQNTIATEFHYEPDNANDTTAQGFVSEFVTTGDTLDLTIQGDGDSSPYASLDQALEGVKIGTSLQGLNHPTLITHINVFITLDTLVTNMVSINFDVANPLDADFNIKFVQSDGGVNGETFAHFDQPFDNFVVPAHGTANSGTFGNVLLVKGALASLGIIPLGRLDIQAAQTVQIDVGGYELPWMKISQPNVPTTYSLALSISEMRSALSSMSASSAGLTGTAVSALSSVASQLSSGVSGGVSSVSSKVSSAVSSVSSEASSAVASLTSQAGGVVGDATSVLGGLVPTRTSA
ncbi:uncharacterized protein FOMMEDRAFT_168292 [Fomitiporia mediterranea MF3/22]|uniref:uncharacterized protein n=1 Tax=Fomitiporia mediterranea (strain MF3/22) TaxID=694068 RepID=UPI00044096E0|nr:uncharacterized protein FOMMEDRAFT_168292 [Fomitiporia mediterranea MF3/22]EJD03283.1 hypothetical protein FOMMEDRAFT_168292 [Fomitiporia mediterranea MF3/22]